MVGVKEQAGHAWLAQHYKWGLDRVFHAPRSHSHVVVVEDDMVFSPDFLHFFQVHSAQSVSRNSATCYR